MWKYIRKYKYQNAAVLGIIALINAVSVFCSLLLMILIHVILEGSIQKTLFYGIVLIAVNVFLWTVLYPASDVWMAKTIALMNQAMREDINQILMKKHYQDLEGKDSGEYLSWYTNDIKEIEAQGFESFYMCGYDVFGLLMNTVVLGCIRLDLLFYTLLTAAVLYWATRKFEKKIESFSRRISDSMEEFTDALKEQLSGFLVWKAFGHLGDFRKHMEEAGEHLEEERYSYVKKKEKTNMMLQWINCVGGTINLAIVFAMCTLRILPVEFLFGGNNFSGEIRSSVYNIMQYRVSIAGARAYFKKFSEMAGATEEKEELPEIRQAIQVRDLSFAYADTNVLNHLDLEFTVGGKYAVVGKSGCGKSTLLKILLGQLKGYKGQVLFDGREAGQFATDSFGKQMAYIEQNVFLFNTSIRENIILGRTVTDEELEEALRRSALWEEMEHFPKGLDTVVGENGSLLSGGQKQRVAVARALIHHCSVLVMDEGTSALDQKNAEVIEDALTSCEDLTVILVTHHLKKEKETEYTAVYHMEQGGARQLCGAI